MTRFTLALTASLLVAAPAFANGQTDQRSFTRDGVTYVYTSTAKDDAQILEGFAKPSNQKFRLIVQNGWVHGTAGGTQVSFRAPRQGKVQVAQR